jgi:hypothetical protein
MTISDLLTLIGILLAIFAFISEKNREYVFLKFSYTQATLLVLIFFFLHFLISYDWWREKFNFLSFFERDGFPIPSAWAYIISLTTLLWAVWKIFKGNFPLSNRERLMKYYEKLLMRNDIAFLSELVEQYHLENVKDFLIAKKSIIIPNETGMWRIDQQEYSKAYDKVINTASTIYGNNVYYRIILNETFIDNVANLNPHLFANVIQELNTEKVKEDDFVNRFLKVITLNKNGNFFREIRENQNLGEFNAYAIEKSRPIIYSLFNDIKVASINQAWRGIAEQALLEIAEEAKKEYSPLRESDREQEHDTVWSFRITIAIWYFDIMVREAIRQNVNDHMWMYYYRHFVESILNNMDELPSPESEQNKSTRNFNLIEDIFCKMMDWKDVATKSKHYDLTECIFDCMGQCLYELTISNKLNDNDKQYLMNWVWEDTIKTFAEEDSDSERAAIDKIINRGFEMFKKPSMLFSISYRIEESEAYLKALSKLWADRDTPILTGLLKVRADKFKTEVIDTLLPS